MNKTIIDWGYPNFYTWNVVTGCLRGCAYCYARRIHKRFNKTPFSEIIFHPKRIAEPARVKMPSTIFCGSISDIEYWKPMHVEIILTICREQARHTFMFLSKNPMSYSGYEWPLNTMQGLTMECSQTQHCQQENIEQMIRYPRPFLSLEPLLGFLKVEIPFTISRVIVGAMTGPGAKLPQREWIDSIRMNVPNEKIFWKPNIKKYL
jgi:protein gp37